MTPEEFRNKYDNLMYQEVIRDGEKVRQMECPECGIIGDIDEDQYRGRVSIDCPECEFHETVNVIEMRRTANRN